MMSWFLGFTANYMRMALSQKLSLKLRSFRDWSQCSVAKWRHNHFMPGRISIARPRIDSLKFRPGFITKRDYPEWSIHQKNVHYSHGWGRHPTSNQQFT